MNIFSKMEQLVDLTNSEILLVEYIKENFSTFTKLTMSELCETCFISKATVYRLCKKLDVQGFSELKLLVLQDYSNFVKENTLDYDFPIKSHETELDVIQNIRSVYDQTITTTLNLMNLEQLSNAALALKNAKQIDVYSSAGNIFFAQNFKFQMEEIGIHIHVPIEEFNQHIYAANSSNDHIAIIISFGGRGRSIESIVGLLKKKKTPIILITSTSMNPLHKYATYRLYMSSYENHFHKISSFSTRLTLLYILDCLFACYFKIDYDQNVKRKLETFNTIRQFPKTFKLD